MDNTPSSADRIEHPFLKLTVTDPNAADLPGGWAIFEHWWAAALELQRRSEVTDPESAARLRRLLDEVSGYLRGGFCFGKPDVGIFANKLCVLFYPADHVWIGETHIQGALAKLSAVPYGNGYIEVSVGPHQATLPRKELTKEKGDNKMARKRATTSNAQAAGAAATAQAPVAPPAGPVAPTSAGFGAMGSMPGFGAAQPASAQPAMNFGFGAPTGQVAAPVQPPAAVPGPTAAATGFGFGAVAPGPSAVETAIQTQHNIQTGVNAELGAAALQQVLALVTENRDAIKKLDKSVVAMVGLEQKVHEMLQAQNAVFQQNLSAVGARLEQILKAGVTTPAPAVTTPAATPQPAVAPMPPAPPVAAPEDLHQKVLAIVSPAVAAYYGQGQVAPLSMVDPKVQNSIWGVLSTNGVAQEIDDNAKLKLVAEAFHKIGKFDPNTMNLLP